MATTTQLSGSIPTLISTGLNSLANNTGVTGSAYSSGGGYLMAELQLDVTFGSAPSAGTCVAVWFLRAIDGTNYETTTGGGRSDARLRITVAASDDTTNRYG